MRWRSSEVEALPPPEQDVSTTEAGSHVTEVV